jgi:hypothetical protein
MGKEMKTAYAVRRIATTLMSVQDQARYRCQRPLGMTVRFRNPRLVVVHLVM